MHWNQTHHDYCDNCLRSFIKDHVFTPEADSMYRKNHVSYVDPVVSVESSMMTVFIRLMAYGFFLYRDLTIPEKAVVGQVSACFILAIAAD